MKDVNLYFTLGDENLNLHASECTITDPETSKIENSQIVLNGLYSAHTIDAIIENPTLELEKTLQELYYHSKDDIIDTLGTLKISYKIEKDGISSDGYTTKEVTYQKAVVESSNFISKLSTNAPAQMKVTFSCYQKKRPVYL